MNDRTATQIFEIRNILTAHCDTGFPPEKIDLIMTEVEEVIINNWAFKPIPEQNE